ncbi:uncharacterized protein BX664DRAFT_329121 [Halteromyces radiatus]|uniref:uncharacterized protein n=1 Tax=Halteromyces radiatus TaxID=101107 RepID=UPI00221EABEE|nr:uncharacterized protein BX664DRAFT_329121 [Halteromyces radiatus]KAI8093192.1 hypothetical protein BX664DRAFT_329121 [Halteromyces radiatus]
MSLPSTIAQHLIDIDNQEYVTSMLKDQEECFDIYQTSQRNLEAFNNFSKSRYQQVHGHFESHTKLLREVKSDLDNVFMKLRKIKNQLELKYPDEMKLALEKYPPLVIEDD